MNEFEWIRSLLTSYYYNRNTRHVIGIIKGTLVRINPNQFNPCEFLGDKDCIEDIDIFYGAIVLRYGDYGTSPRYGWVNGSCKQLIVMVLKEEIKQYESILKLEEKEKE